jgi:hypothetical protein
LITTSGKDGIYINASNVTIDLNGFTIRGQTGSRNGVYGASVQCVTVRNGRVVSMGSYGMYIPESGTLPQNVVIEDVVVRNCGSAGIQAGSGIFRNCQSDRNGSIGIFITGFADSIIENCTANGNGSDGINAGHGNITSSSAKGNTGTGISLNSGTIRHCTAAENAVEIINYIGSVLDSTVANNTTTGIRVNGDCLVRGNSVTANTVRENTIGIQVQNTNGARIENNQIVRMTAGINTLTSDNLIVGNSLRGCTNAVNVAANNRVGTIVTGTASPAILGNSGGGLGTTDPLANIIY